jgi:glutamate---cysteine ligase / carboxylate-amine ligase
MHTSSASDPVEHAFGNGTPFTVGVEEELFLVDPVSGRQTNASTAVLERLGPVTGTVERELHACQVELISDVCDSAGSAGAQLTGLRRAVVDTGAGLLGAGTHPAALEGEAEITDKERYEQIRNLLGDAVATPVGGLHIHVGMPDAETAIKTFNGLRRHLPLLQALAANSPYRHGRDTGLGSAREVTVRGWPRSGVSARLPDADGRLRPVRELLDDALVLARAHAAELGRLNSLLARGGGAGRQRAAYAITGMDGLLRELTALTSGALAGSRAGE